MKALLHMYGEATLKIKIGILLKGISSSLKLLGRHEMCTTLDEWISSTVKISKEFFLVECWPGIMQMTSGPPSC